jgi:uracil permease
MSEKLNLKLIVMGLQHTFVMFGATVLVPLLTGLDVGVTLFAAGIGTLIFHVVTKFKVPVFLGSSFAFLPGIFAIAEA